MRLKIRHTTFSDLKLGFIYLLIGTVGFIFTRFNPNLFETIPPCLFRQITGIPCPACGATHSGYYLSHFQIIPAFLTNPFFFILFVGLIVWGCNTAAGLIFKKKLQLILTVQESKIIRFIIITSFPLNWLYLIIVNYFIGRK
ncbi:DUF2752 domain-containing protein [candidate division KSB1 bacterium]|nr:DUF2752 domain-containing protein [candidate division KSB1 bacterium]